MTYKLHENKDYEGNVISTYILNKEKGCYIPNNPDNSDYQAYLEWAKTNTVEKAD
tara:strand:+ start:1049 stop:1213 length:165 start_codon:yes stop_codon:yes gene_type:complete